MTAQAPIHLADMTWPEIAAAASRNVPVVLAIGACEQHGPHLPVVEAITTEFDLEEARTRS